MYLFVRLFLTHRFALTVSFTPSPLSFVLRDFLLAVLTQTSHVGGVSKGASALANETLSDSSVTGRTVQQRRVSSVL